MLRDMLFKRAFERPVFAIDCKNLQSHELSPLTPSTLPTQVADTNHSTGPTVQEQPPQPQEVAQDPDAQHADNDTESIASETSTLSRANSDFPSQMTAEGKLDPNVHSARVTAICKLCKLHVEIDRNEAAREQVRGHRTWKAVLEEGRTCGPV